MKTKRTGVVVEGEVKAVEEEEVEEEEVDDEGVDDEEGQLRIVGRVCDAVDREVESRSAAIMAISDGHMTSVSEQLQLMMSKFPEHIRKMPVKKFLKQHCPNTEPNACSDGTLPFDLVQDPAFQPPGWGTLGVSTGFSSATLATHPHSNAVSSESSACLSWRDTMVTRNYTRMIKKTYPAIAAMLPS